MNSVECSLGCTCVSTQDGSDVKVSGSAGNLSFPDSAHFATPQEFVKLRQWAREV